MAHQNAPHIPRVDIVRFAEISAQAYIDEFPDHADINPQWLRQTWELDAAQQRWFTCTWEPYRAAARVKFLKEKTAERMRWEQQAGHAL